MQPNPSFFAVHRVNQAYLEGRAHRPRLNQARDWLVLAVGVALLVWMAAEWDAGELLTVDAGLGEIALYGFLFLCCLLLIGVGVRNFWIALLGRVVDGRLTGASLVRSGSRGGSYWSLRVEYEFRSPAGRVLKGTTFSPRGDLEGQPLPPAGTPIKVMYLTDHLHQAV